jgi:hypothetical protein
MRCRLCGTDSSGVRSEEGGECALPLIVAADPFGLTCGLCGVALPARQRAAPFLEKLKQLAQFGLASNARLLSEPSRAEN